MDGFGDGGVERFWALQMVPREGLDIICSPVIVCVSVDRWIVMYVRMKFFVLNTDKPRILCCETLTLTQGGHCRLAASPQESSMPAA